MYKCHERLSIVFIALLLAIGLSACDGESLNHQMTSSARASTLLASSSSSSSGVEMSSLSFSSEAGFHVDLWLCPDGFDPVGSPLHVCNSRVKYIGGYAPSEKCSGGLFDQGICFQPRNVCSWGFDTEICTSACSDAPDAPYCSQSSQVSSSSTANAISSNVNTACDALDLSSKWSDYYSENLQSVTRSDPSITKGFWGVGFNKGQITLVDGDTVIEGTYLCNDNQIIATYSLGGGPEEHLIEIKTESATELVFDPYGEGLTTYQMAAHKLGKPSEDCVKVKGRSYTGSTLESLKARFSSAVNSVTYIGFDGIEREGIYSCDKGAIEIYSSAMQAIEINAPTVLVQDNGSSLFFGKRLLNEDPIACKANYAPVCGVVETEVQCMSLPCQELKTYKTFGNSCSAFGVHADVVAKGECGELEGEAAK